MFYRNGAPVAQASGTGCVFELGNPGYARIVVGGMESQLVDVQAGLDGRWAIEFPLHIPVHGPSIPASGLCLRSPIRSPTTTPAVLLLWLSPLADDRDPVDRLAALADQHCRTRLISVRDTGGSGGGSSQFGLRSNGRTVSARPRRHP